MSSNTGYHNDVLKKYIFLSTPQGQLLQLFAGVGIQNLKSPTIITIYTFETLFQIIYTIHRMQTKALKLVGLDDEPSKLKYLLQICSTTKK